MNGTLVKGLGLFFVRWSVAVAMVWAPGNHAFADMEGQNLAGESAVLVKGEVKVALKPRDVIVEGEAPMEVYDNELHGGRFEVEFAGLPAGKYTVTVYLAETFFREPKERVMGISHNGKAMVESLDLAETVGWGKEYLAKGEIDHVGGTLVLEFKATKNEAMFNAIVVEDSEGKPVATVYARDFQLTGTP